MSGSTTTDQSGSSSQVNQIPQWVQNAGQQNYGLAQQVASQPLQQYQGQMVADTAPQTQQAWNLAANSGNVGQDAQSAAQAGYLNTLGQTPQNVQAGQLSNTNLQPYMNPYTQNVINATLPIMQQNLGLQQNQQQNAANSANAFGGSRQAIQQGVTQAQGAQNMAQMAQQLNQANFTQAQGAAQGDIANTLKAQQGNQSAALQQGALANQASAGLGTLGNQQMQNNIANYGMLTSAGGFEQQQAQNQINAQLAKFNQAFQYPQQQLGMMESALGMTPYDTGSSGTSNSTTTQTQSNPASMALGGLSTLSGLMSLSDRSMKTDITKLGKDPKTGLDMHAYRYKGDPKSYPKVVGPMAQDVEKMYPGSTERVGKKGKLAIRHYAGGTPFVAPNMDDAELGSQLTDAQGPTVTYPSGQSQQLMMGPPQYQPMTTAAMQQQGMGPIYGRASGRAIFNDPRAAPLADPETFPAWKQYAAGTSFVTPNMDDADLGSQLMDPSGASMFAPPQGAARPQQQQPLPTEAQLPAPPPLPTVQPGAAHIYRPQGYAMGTPHVPGRGRGDTVPAMLTPGEAVLRPHVAQAIGRGNIAMMNALPPSSPGVARVVGALGGRQGPLQPGVATPPSRSIIGMEGKRRMAPRMPILGALGSGR